VTLYESEQFTYRYRDVCYERWIEPIIEGSPTDLRRPAF
jgi:hypothetical protein